MAVAKCDNVSGFIKLLICIDVFHAFDALECLWYMDIFNAG